MTSFRECKKPVYRHPGMCHILRWTPCKVLPTSLLEKNLPFDMAINTLVTYIKVNMLIFNF